MVKLKETFEFIAALFYRAILFFRKSKPGSVVLYYHSLSKEDEKQFEKQMAYLAQRYHVVKPSEILNHASFNDGVATISITFDDAFRTVFENAFPVLKKYNLNAGVFVPTGGLGKKIFWKMEAKCVDGGKMLMGADQICELDHDNWEIFSHTVSHPHLTEMGSRRLNDELRDSKIALEEMLGHKITGISYPYGEHNEHVRRAALNAGYRMGFTIDPELNYSSQNKMSIGRFSVSAKDSLLKFKLKACGAYEVSKHLRAAKRKFVGHSDRRVALDGI